MDKDHDLVIVPGKSGEDEAAPTNGGTTVTEPSAPPAGLAEAYQKALEEKRELYDRLLRKQAELENYRKRTQREKEELRQYAAEDLIRSLLPTLDGFERALQHRDARVPESFYQGLELIYRQFREVLSRTGLTAIDTVGQTFDPQLHHAVETVPTASRREHEIVEELQGGYKLRNKLLRPAIVKVAVGTPSAAAPPNRE